MEMIETPIFSPITLRDAVSKVFSTMVFMSTNPAASITENLSAETCIMGNIAFLGLFEGALTVRCSMACAKEITMNLLAFDDDSEMEPSDIPDAIGEVANMIMGTVKTLLYDQVGELTVSSPSVFSGMMLNNEMRAGQVRISASIGVDSTYCLEVNMIYKNGKQK